MDHHELTSPGDLDRRIIGELARGTCRVTLSPALVNTLTTHRQHLLEALSGDQPVYGVNTGMGAMAGVRLDPEAQQRHQDTLMTGRAVGSAPWLRREEARALLATRLRTLLHPAAGVSPALCQHVIDLLDADVIPAIPARGSGAAGEIIPLAHAGAVLLGTGEVLPPAAGRPSPPLPVTAGHDPHGATDAGPALTTTGHNPHDATDAGSAPTTTGHGSRGTTDAGSAPTAAGNGSRGTTDAGPALAAAGLRPLSFEAKEGVAFLEGVPGLTGLAILATEHARTLIAQNMVVAAASHALVRANRDPLTVGSPAADALLRLLGDGPVGALQAPVSFRVTAPALDAALRATAALEAAVDRALTEVTDSPAYLDGRFVGTAGFAGTDLAAACGALTTALVHLADVGTARLHRLLDPAHTGLPRQLSDTPGAHAGMVTVHKRAAGVAHRLRRFTLPALGGTIETSLGQEDVQSFGFEAAECLGEAVGGLRDVLACELLAVHQARLLGGEQGGLPGAVAAALNEVAAVLPAGTADRPFGRDLDRLIDVLADGWAADLPGTL
ncbi:aromatic amino acid lyase [Actinoplanes sp. N902-109]|uniref:aromatic amino acid lyase n=1 Tax=Actinoplanes sp. (strain N902-109) TaxID=649831 RepID=UPI000329489B|nr:aromatic amino acid lyase [Actinoplanes sp. N902-109]AGL17134.1 phenylalanine/histidine ammonia-lyase [Actinoplanes sp. N902-109]